MYGLRDYLGFLRSWQRVSSGMSLLQNNVKANWLVSSWVMRYLCTRRPPPPPTPGWPRTPGRWWTLPATRQTRWQRPAGREPGRNLQTQRDADTDGSSHPQGEAAVSRKADRPDRCRGDKEKKKKTPTKRKPGFPQISEWKFDSRELSNRQHSSKDIKSRMQPELFLACRQWARWNPVLSCWKYCTAWIKRIQENIIPNKALSFCSLLKKLPEQPECVFFFYFIDLWFHILQIQVIHNLI